MKNKKNPPNSQDQKEKSFNEFPIEYLRDYKKSGKLRDWDKRATINIELTKACREIVGLEKYGEIICNCGKDLEFKACVIPEHGKKLKRANFCHYRMCAMCQPIKASKVRNEVYELAKAHLEKFSDDIPLLLTLTAPNIEGEFIGREIDEHMKAFERLVKRKVVKNMNRSWFRSLEVTRNHKRNDYHPHFHVLLMVPPEYFHKNSPLYITRDKWLKLWQESKRNPAITQVDIRALKGAGEQKLEALIAEVAKYATKPSSYVYESKGGKFVVNKEAFEHLHYGLKGRRTIGYGGYFKEVRKANRLEALEKSALKAEEKLNEDVTAEEEKQELCRECHQPMVDEKYRYHNEIKRYRKIQLHNNGPGHHDPP
jgi:plasmid rolling circle replication initiator protein Rep